MKPHFRLAILIVMLLLVLMLGVSLTQAQQEDSNSSTQTSSQANLPWSWQYVQQQIDPPQDVGGYVSMAILPFNDFLAISYYDATNHSLMVATPVLNHAGNCGTNNNWGCLTLDGNAGAVGKYTSTDLWGDSTDNWKWGTSYYDETHHSLKSAIYSCYYGTCSWMIAPVLVPDVPGDAIGLYSSIKFDSSGNAAIAFTKKAANTESTLQYAYQVPSGGNCGEGAAAGLWHCDDIFYVGGSVEYPSLDFRYDDKAYIAYYDAGYGLLRLAIEGGLCMPEIGWSCDILDGTGNAGLYPVMIAPRSAGDVFRIAYHDKTHGYLKYYQEDWGAVKVDNMGSSISPMGISMIMDDSGNPVIAYQKITGEFAPPKLSIARPAYEYGADYGNCGDTPPGYLYIYWQCTTLDTGGQYTEEANFASMVMSSNGLLGIAYTEYDSGLDVTSLKFTYQIYLRNYLPLTTK